MAVYENSLDFRDAQGIWVKGPDIWDIWDVRETTSAKEGKYKKQIQPYLDNC